MCADKLCTQGEQGKEGGSRTETKDLSCSSKVPYLHVRYSTCIYPVFFTEMVISSSQRGTSISLRIPTCIFQLGPDPWLLRVSGVISAFLSRQYGEFWYCNHLAKKICGRAGPDHLEELHLDTCWDMNCQWLQVRFVRG